MDSMKVQRIITVPMGLITALGTVMLPRMSSPFASGDKGKARGYIRLSMEFVCFMGFALMFGIAGVAKEFSPVFFGTEFTSVGSLIMLIFANNFFQMLGECDPYTVLDSVEVRQALRDICLDWRCYQFNYKLCSYWTICAAGAVSGYDLRRGCCYDLPDVVCEKKITNSGISERWCCIFDSWNYNVCGRKDGRHTFWC